MDTPNYNRVDRIKIRARRLSRAVGLGWLHELYSRTRNGFVFRNPDPLETGPLLLSIIRRLPPDLPDHVELDEVSLESYLDDKVTQAPGYKLQDCFNRLLRELGPTRNRYSRLMCGERRAYFLFRSDGKRIHVHRLERFDSEPRLTRDQSQEFFRRVNELENPDPSRIAAVRREVLERG